MYAKYTVLTKSLTKLLAFRNVNNVFHTHWSDVQSDSSTMSSEHISLRGHGNASVICAWNRLSIMKLFQGERGKNK